MNYGGNSEMSERHEEPTSPIEEHKSPETNKKKSWMALASYVDELTVGGRRDSKGRFVDNLGSFPGFGSRKKEKIPQDCFPSQFFEK